MYLSSFFIFYYIFSCFKYRKYTSIVIEKYPNIGENEKMYK